MIFRAILPDEIQAGDVIQVNPRRLPYAVEDLGSRAEDVMTIKVAGQREHIVIPRHVYVRLLHRPWPKGATERGMLHMISTKAYEFNEAAEDGDVEKCRAIARELREAIEVYELGLRPEPEKK